jgi:hypothetical protein
MNPSGLATIAFVLAAITFVLAATSTSATLSGSNVPRLRTLAAAFRTFDTDSLFSGQKPASVHNRAQCAG